MKRSPVLLAIPGMLCVLGGAATAGPSEAVVMRTATAEDENPFAAGKAAATALKTAMAGVEPQVVLVGDCFEDRENKEKLLEGLATVFPREKLWGGSFYGSYTQAGVVDLDAVTLLGLGGHGIEVEVALQEKMGAVGLTLEENEKQLTANLGKAGEELARKLPGLAEAALLIVVADAHSPKNQLLLDGIQSVAGKKLPVTGGCVNKNAGQNWVYFRGAAYTDSAIALTLTGDFAVGQSGRQAKSNDAVISTAKDSSTEALQRLGKEPLAVLAFDCAGRMGKLDDVSEELAALQAALGKDVPLFGCYCAGEFGPADEEGADPTLSCGRGWHVMVSALGRGRREP